MPHLLLQNSHRFNIVRQSSILYVSIRVITSTSGFPSIKLLTSRMLKLHFFLFPGLPELHICLQAGHYPFKRRFLNATGRSLLKCLCLHTPLLFCIYKVKTYFVRVTPTATSWLVCIIVVFITVTFRDVDLFTAASTTTIHCCPSRLLMPTMWINRGIRRLEVILSKNSPSISVMVPSVGIDCFHLFNLASPFFTGSVEFCLFQDKRFRFCADCSPWDITIAEFRTSISLWRAALKASSWYIIIQWYIYFSFRRTFPVFRSLCLLFWIGKGKGDLPFSCFISYYLLLPFLVVLSAFTWSLTTTFCSLCMCILFSRAFLLQTSKH